MMMMMVELAHEEQTCKVLNPIMQQSDHQMLRKAMSDVTKEISKLGLESIAELKDNDKEEDDETITFQAECECCGLKEECTNEYITRIRDSYSGKWVCGLCSEAVKERLSVRHVDVPQLAMEEAVKFVREFNTTTRVNPKLSFAWAMRGIAKKSSEKRHNTINASKIMRTSSCVPRIQM